MKRYLWLSVPVVLGLLVPTILVVRSYVYPEQEIKHPEPGVYYRVEKDGKPRYIMMPGTQLATTVTDANTGSTSSSPYADGLPTDVADVDDKYLTEVTVLKSCIFDDGTVAVYRHRREVWKSGQVIENTQWTVWTLQLLKRYHASKANP